MVNVRSPSQCGDFYDNEYRDCKSFRLDDSGPLVSMTALSTILQVMFNYGHAVQEPSGEVASSTDVKFMDSTLVNLFKYSLDQDLTKVIGCLTSHSHGNIYSSCHCHSFKDDLEVWCRYF